MKNYKIITLGELYDVHNGMSKSGKYFGRGFPFLSFSTVFNNFFLPDELFDYVQSTDFERQNFSIRRGDVFVTRTSETSDELGMSCVALKDYPDATYNGFTKRMRPTTDQVLPEFIGYYMRMPSFRNEFKAFSSMTTRASLKNEDLLSLSIRLPSFDQQKRIASFLRCYDYLIENNQRQIVCIRNGLWICVFPDMSIRLLWTACRRDGRENDLLRLPQYNMGMHLTALYLTQLVMVHPLYVFGIFLMAQQTIIQRK